MTDIELFDNELFAIFVIVFDDASIVLFVNVSVVALPTKVSVAVGKVTVPELLMVLITGAVKVLLVNVCDPANVA